MRVHFSGSIAYTSMGNILEIIFVCSLKKTQMKFINDEAIFHLLENNYEKTCFIEV